MAFTELQLGKPLYHYTSLRALEAIISSKKFRFTRADETNDPFEIVFMRDSALADLARLSAQKASVGKSWASIADSYRRVSEPSKFYISCFTSDPESVAMWRLYAGEGTGVVLGLRPRAFDGFDCRLNKVQYLRPEELIEASVSAVEKSMGEALDSEIGDQRFLVPVAVRLLEATVNTKRVHWRYEQEYRFSFSFDPFQYKSIETYVEQKLHARMSKYAPVDNVAEGRSFLFQEFGKRRGEKVDFRRAISDVIVGPKCERTESEISELLIVNGFTDFEVSRSSATWR